MVFGNKIMLIDKNQHSSPYYDPSISNSSIHLCMSKKMAFLFMLYLFTGLDGLDFQISLMLVFALIFILVYEFINGFHDTANAVATIIYTRALHSQLAVIMSGIFNLLGVIMGGLSVAYSIVHILPTELLLNASSDRGLAMMFSVLLAAILWNIGTWYFGLPSSSSHTLIGAIVGIGLTNAIINGSSIVKALNISKLIEIFLSLIISPLVGLMLASAIVFILHCFTIKNSRKVYLVFQEKKKKDYECKPPFWTRVALICSAAGVSFSHGANDGQKGIGLIMLTLIGVAPASFVVNIHSSTYDIGRTRDAVNRFQQYYAQHLTVFNSILEYKKTFTSLMYIPFNKESLFSLSLIPNNSFFSTTTNNELIVFNSLKDVKIHHQNQKQNFYCSLPRISFIIDNALSLLKNIDSYKALNADQRYQLRRLLMCIADLADQIAKEPEISITDKRFLKNLRHDLLYTIEYAPMCIVIAVALSLSLGTMVGWRRVAKTIGEKIGKRSMTYIQGLSAQMTTAVSIGVASYTGMPVSTTHVLSSAVIGTMIVSGGGIHSNTVKNIFFAWILTLPMTILLASIFYWLSLKLI